MQIKLYGELSTNVYTISDERLKKDIRYVNIDNCYDIIKKLPLKQYTYTFSEKVCKNKEHSSEKVCKNKEHSLDNSEKQETENDNSNSKIGWVAQDVEKYIPNAVRKEAILGLPDCRKINTDQIIATLYGCVQKLIEKVENQEHQLNVLAVQSELKDIEIQQLIDRINVLYTF